MDKEWISQLASDIKEKYGKETCDKIFGDIDGIKDDHESLSTWFGNFTSAMDELDDKEFLQQMMVKHCPCGGNNVELGKVIKEFYDNSNTLEEFVNSLYKWLYEKYNGDVDAMELRRGNVLYLIKPLKVSKNAGRFGKGCHCSLAMYTEKTVSDIFCYCCTIGHTGKMFKIAFGDEIKIEFIESIITGGKECTMAVHLPEKQKTSA